MTPAGAEAPPDPRTSIEQLAHDAFGARVVTCTPLEPGLGRRRFYRVVLDATPFRVIARVEAPEDSAIRPTGVPPEPLLEPLRSFLADAGLPVPKRYASDDSLGIELLEDLGDRSLEVAAAEVGAEERRALYHEACALIPRLQRLRASPDAIPAFGRALDHAHFAYKAEEVVKRVLPWGLGRAPSRGEGSAVKHAFAMIAAEARGAPQRLAHRDFKAANLHVLADRPPGARLVMIDLQGALLAPPEYDLVCLLRDSHVPLPDDEVQRHLMETRGELPDAPEPNTFARRFELLTLSRVGKDLARYLFAACERGDRRYLRLLPQALGTLHAAARRAAGWGPELNRLSEVFGELKARSVADSPSGDTGGHA